MKAQIKNLKPNDHTKIMVFLWSNYWRILSELDVKAFMKSGKKPTIEQVLKAALKVDRIKKNETDLINYFLSELPAYIKSRIEIKDEKLLKQMNALKTKLDKKKKVSDLIKIYKNEFDGLKEQVDPYAIGVNCALDILIDGEKDVYGNTMFLDSAPGGFDWGGMASDDAWGALNGAIDGAVSTGLNPAGIAGGAVYGGVKASITNAIGQLASCD